MTEECKKNDQGECINPKLEAKRQAKIKEQKKGRNRFIIMMGILLGISIFLGVLPAFIFDTIATEEAYTTLFISVSTIILSIVVSVIVARLLRN